MERSSSKACPGGSNLICATRCRTLHRSAPAPSPRKVRSWLIALQIEVADVHGVRRKASNLVGVDRGVERLATLSSGETTANVEARRRGGHRHWQSPTKARASHEGNAPAAESRGASGAAGLQARQPSQQPFASADLPSQPASAP